MVVTETRVAVSENVASQLEEVVEERCKVFDSVDEADSRDVLDPVAFVSMLLEVLVLLADTLLAVDVLVQLPV